MTSKSLLILSIQLAGAWASANACLDPQASGEANKKSCCAGSGNGQATVGATLYEYTCNSYANNYGAASLDAASAYECAELCSNDASCHASSWQPSSGSGGGHCWLSSAGFKLTPDPYKLWVILVNTQRAGHVVNPIPPVDPVSPDCTACEEEKKKCQLDKDDCESQLGPSNAALGACEVAKTSLEGKLAKCEADKALLENKLKPTPPPDLWPACSPNAIHNGRTGGQEWKIWCTQHWHDPYNVGLETTASSLQQCAELCAGNSLCKSVIFGHANGPHKNKCLFKAQLHVADTPEYRNTIWHTASKLQ